MSEGPAATAKPRRLLVWALWGVALLGVAAVVYIIVQASTKQAPSAPSAPPPAARSFASKVVRPAGPTPAPDYVFYDDAGRPRRIADFKGEVVVMNVWATWCAPCVTEMPTLARLQAEYAAKPVKVVAVSIDSAESAAKARLFIARHEPLAFYHDRSLKLPFALKPPAAGAPTTIIYGKDGMERARVSGEADWSGAEAKALVEEALAAG